MKSGRGYKEAIVQLLKRFAVLYRAAGCIIGDNFNNFSVHFHGIVITSQPKWIKPTKEQLTNIISESGLNLPVRVASIEILKLL